MPKKKPGSKKQNKNLVAQFAQYMVGGGLWFWSGYILIVWLDEPLGLFAANVIGNGVGITLNFLVQHFWAFDSKESANISNNLWRYVVYTAINAFGLNYIILYGLREWAGIGPEIGQFIASGFFMLWNYYWYKKWVFRSNI